MKRTQFLIVLALLGVAASFWQCGSDSDPAPDPQDEQLTKLSQTWKATNATFNSSAVTGYENFKLTMTGTPGDDTFDFTATGITLGLKTPWPASGKFKFGTDFATVLTRNPGTEDLQVTYSVTSTQLQMTFTYSGTEYTGTGRTSNINGSWTFTFSL